MIQVTARLPDDLGAELDTAAEQLHRSRAEIIRQALEYYKKLMAFLPADVPAHLTGDPLRLRQSLVRLGRAAIGNVASGQVVLGVEEASRSGDRIQLSFWVDITGGELSREQRETLVGTVSGEGAATLPGNADALRACR